MIDIRQMRYFVALAETLHFGRAAERLHISQPPLSRQIASLEAELGVRLLERHSRRAKLTHTGERFLEDARRVVADFDQACRNARLAEAGELGELAIGFMMHAAHTVMPGLTRRYVERFPQVRLELREMLPNLLPDAVLTGRFDAAITFASDEPRGLTSRRVHEESLCLVLHPDHRLAKESQIGPEHLAGEPLIAAPADAVPILYEAILRYCRSGGVEPVFRLQASLQQTIVSLVAEGLGLALVPRSMGKSGHAGVIFRDLTDAPTVAHALMWRPGNRNPALRAFLIEAGALVSKDSFPSLESR